MYEKIIFRGSIVHIKRTHVAVFTAIFKVIYLMVVIKTKKFCKFLVKNTTFECSKIFSHILYLQATGLISIFLCLCQYIYIYKYIYIYIYIYCHPQTGCFIVSQLFCVARYVGCLKLGSKPTQLYFRLTIRPHGQHAYHIS